MPEVFAQRVVRALTEAWDELPGALGPAWPEIFPQLAALTHKLARTSDEDRRAALVMQLVRLFAVDPDLARRLQSRTVQVVRGHAVRSYPGADVPEPAWRESLEALGACVRSITALRHTDVFAPRRLRPGARGVVTVRLTRPPLAASVAPAIVDPGSFGPVTLCLHVPPGDFAVEGGPTRTIDISPDADSDTAVYYITALRASNGSLRLDVRRCSVLLTTLELPIAVGEGREDGAAAAGSVIVVGESRLEPADLELRIVEDTRDGRSVLSFVLHSPSGRAGFHHYPVGETRLSGSPRELQARLMKQLESEAGRSADSLRRLGQNLYEELFPAELRRRYREISELPLRSLQITSDEPWIPWELVRPYDDEAGGDPLNHDHLCARFELTRWLAGRAGPPDVIAASSMAFLDGAGAPLAAPIPSVAAERAHLRALAGRLRVLDISPDGADARSLNDLLDNAAANLGIWHFAGHGDVSVLQLADGSQFAPHDLAGERGTAIRTRRPLVFLNACRAGQQEPSWTQLGGWAAAWSGRCWAAFVGPLWSVSDGPAGYFAATFYDELAAGSTLGRAVARARAATRRRWPDDPTWLSYSLYAHPNTTVRFGP